MQKLLTRTALATLALTIGSEAMATEWNVSLWGQRRAFTEHVERLAELVSERTNGEFTLNISYGGLSSNRENLDGISIGAFEMAQFCAGYHADKNPSITVLELPFLGVTSLEQEVALSMALYQHPAAVADLERWNATLLMPSPLPQYNLVGVGDAPTSLADFEGLTVRATGGIGAAMSTVGAVPTSMSATEVRQAMDSGVVRAVSFAPHAHMSFGTIENATWWTTNLNPGTVNCPVVVNSDALASLSDEEREVLLGAVDEALDHYVTYYNEQTMAAWGPALEERDITQVTFPEAEIAAFREAAADPAAAAWIEDNTARGLPAQELYDFVTGMIAEGN
ncbi:C4-dicarboxylate TRAP transporter substrate-binding protein [Rhodobacteraceae bacterium N5(2021)]|uniref:C4-dicarboxylate TRAP transporter substrate-binding protein n=1 Tax=Gymnodinialimonas phycosphaerae TaxID=2841589 RepID=A0A975YE70_9RHOB|nr:C4-dicarboxylate TRAP transporter substrate-binding protein [Gymnodinialimonas phycosphaerae]MBY4893318.1 C4-dicarboxylate TRAP transporter substrate-binding protein [Gymnodinialimonas phycosphaerae]